MMRQNAKILWFCAGTALFSGFSALAAASNVEDEVRLLREQNALLQEQVKKQGSALEALTEKVQQLETANESKNLAHGENPPPTTSGLQLGNLHISGEGGVAFFDTGADGFAPNSEFRVDEARIFVEAPIWESVFFYTDIDLATRENTGLSTQLGELYLDFEDVSQLWGRDAQANLRLGRLNNVFGEEYLTRYAMENPLISHSLTDFWGIDPGVELYGRLGKFSYVVAVQNGGINGVQDFEGDKSVMGRLSFDPNDRWHFSLSGIRTGDLDAQANFGSALWFGNAVFRSIGGPATTKFHVDGVEGDITTRWRSGHLSGFGGYLHYGDNDPAANNGRDIYFYSVEAEQNLPHKFYLATRFSQIFAPHGYPIVGFGNFNEYFFATEATSLWRLSLGGGYRFSKRLAVKAEYSLEQGSNLDGSRRHNVDFVGTEAVFKF